MRHLQENWLNSIAAPLVLVTSKRKIDDITPSELQTKSKKQTPDVTKQQLICHTEHRISPSHEEGTTKSESLKGQSQSTSPSKSKIPKILLAAPVESAKSQALKRFRLDTSRPSFLELARELRQRTLLWTITDADIKERIEIDLDALLGPDFDYMLLDQKTVSMERN